MNHYCIIDLLCLLYVAALPALPSLCPRHPACLRLYQGLPSTCPPSTAAKCQECLGPAGQVGEVPVRGPGATAAGPWGHWRTGQGRPPGGSTLAIRQKKHSYHGQNEKNLHASYFIGLS